MKVRNKLTPYPILSSYGDDYRESYFETKIEVFCQFGEVVIDVNFSLKDDGIQTLIENGKAVFTAHVECPSTSFRVKYETVENSLSIKLSTNKLNDIIEVCTFIVVKEEIKAYANPNFHYDYLGNQFDLDKGNILAIGTGKRINIIKNNDDLEKLPSIIKIQKKKDVKTGAISVDTDDSHYILIGIYEGIIDSYYSLGRSKYKNTVLSLVLLPAMELVLLRMRDAEEDEKEKKWFQVIAGLLEQNGIQIENLDINNRENSVLTVAQKIFEDPIARSFEELETASMEE